MLEFLCPNGHHLRCDTKQVGRAAKCPRCGVRFLVPSPADDESAEEVTGADADAAGSSGSIVLQELTPPNEIGSADGAAGGAVADAGGDTQFTFLCPKGHRLYGSVRLQGKPAQCPECLVRFRVPIPEELSFDESGGAVQTGATVERGADRPDSAADPSAATHPAALESKCGAASSEAIPNRSEAKHPMNVAFERLWNAKPADGAVELRLHGGEKLTPERLLPSLSGSAHLGCVVKEPDGDSTVHVVAWEAVARIVGRGIGDVSESP